jgi:hypothetical protein
MDYDNLFKTVLHLYFWEALKILVPELYEAADRNEDPVFLEQELQKIILDLGEKRNRTDLLIRIKLKNNREELILCHLEIQGKGGGDLTVRMYRYKEMIHLQHGEEPLGIAILTAPRPRKEKKSYRWERFGVRVAYDYLSVPVIKLEDTVLLAEGSRIGIILYAAKCMWQSGNDEGKKFEYLQYHGHVGATRLEKRRQKAHTSGDRLFDEAERRRIYRKIFSAHENIEHERGGQENVRVGVRENV